MRQSAIRTAALALLVYACAVPNPAIDEIAVMVAANEVEAGTTVTERDLYAVNMPVGLLPEGCFLSPEYVVGRVATERLLANEIVRGARLSNHSNHPLGVALPDGMRASSVPLASDDMTVRFVSKGSTVDVLATLPGAEGVHTKTVLRAVSVLAVDQQAPSVTLLVDTKQAENLASASSSGALRLTMRGENDDRPAETSGANNGNLTEPASTRSSIDGPSTFDMSVDSTTWGTVGLELRNHRLPRGDRIRADDFISRPRYGYPYPTGHESFAADIEAAPTPWSEDRVLVRVGLQSRRIDWTSRRPVHLTIVVDTSGSMKGPRRMGLIRDTLLELAEELGPYDTVALVTYGDRGRLLIDHTSDRLEIQVAVLDLEANDEAALHEALELAYSVAGASIDTDDDNRILLLSDGDANLGRGDMRSTLQVIAEHANEGIELTGIGFGQGNYGDPAVEDLINHSGGSYWYADDAQEARQILIDRTVGLAKTVARNASVRVEWNSDVVSGASIVGDDRADSNSWRALGRGEIDSDNQITMLYEVSLADSAPQDELGKVHLRWESPRGGKTLTRQYTIRSSSVRAWNRTAHNYRLAVAEATFARKLQGERDMPTWDEIAGWVKSSPNDAAPELADLTHLAASAALQQCRNAE